MNTATKSAHTPGPWEALHDFDGDYAIVGRQTNKGPLIAVTEGDTETDEANARLIAKAPELLEALIKAEVLVRMAYQCPEWLQGYRTAESDDAKDFIESVIRKAKGAL